MLAERLIGFRNPDAIAEQNTHQCSKLDALLTLQASNSEAGNSLPLSTADPRRRMHSPQAVSAGRIREANDIVFASGGSFGGSVNSSLGAISGRRNPLAIAAAPQHIGAAAAARRWSSSSSSGTHVLNAAAAAAEDPGSAGVSARRADAVAAAVSSPRTELQRVLEERLLPLH
eukprot:CAMPEP_0172165174 /NCGR_PEP_ID=MMETSP1050-20130122/8268_1 /TAXON_ID=233186 /ORGANISM="Cryptomonas curvata, Strain CCAP979/52" /LENGTH=172 /DNA_ID=CAMNT_0012835621 /DNA_START=539 /DNA_END=1054 /DNA_ORIENTATION=-